MTEQATAIRTPQTNRMRCRIHRALTVAAATTGALALWVVTGPLTGIDPSVRSAGTVETVGAGAVLVSSLLAGLAAWASLAIVERLTDRPRRIWIPLAVAVFVVSLLGPLGSAVDLPSTAVLIGMHFEVGVWLLVGLPRPR
jgi:hypothetical protein